MAREPRAPSRRDRAVAARGLRLARPRGPTPGRCGPRRGRCSARRDRASCTRAQPPRPGRQHRGDATTARARHAGGRARKDHADLCPPGARGAGAGPEKGCERAEPRQTEPGQVDTGPPPWRTATARRPSIAAARARRNWRTPRSPGRGLYSVSTSSRSAGAAASPRPNSSARAVPKPPTERSPRTVAAPSAAVEVAPEIELEQYGSANTVSHARSRDPSQPARTDRRRPRRASALRQRSRSPSGGAVSSGPPRIAPHGRHRRVHGVS